MARILITGMSGTGKTAVLDELRRRGHRTLDTDYGGWVLADGSWDEPRMVEYLRGHRDLFVSGTVENQGQFYDRFDHVVLFTAPLEVILSRVGTRSNNPYGTSAEDRNEIREYVATVEPLLRRGATLELDARRSVSSLADEVEGLVARGDQHPD